MPVHRLPNTNRILEPMPYGIEYVKNKNLGLGTNEEINKDTQHIMNPIKNVTLTPILFTTGI